MRFRSVITSNRDLKKNGYKLMRKLHKIEKRKGADKAYKAIYEDTYMFVLYSKALTDLIVTEYGINDELIIKFKNKCDWFVNYLTKTAETKSKINKSYLVSYLKAYTKFFNKIIERGYPFVSKQEIIEKWNIGCLMAYIATWGI